MDSLLTDIANPMPPLPPSLIKLLVSIKKTSEWEDISLHSGTLINIVLSVTGNPVKKVR
jgi:hypothetical protein